MTCNPKALSLAFATATAFAALASAASASTHHFTGVVGAKLKVTANNQQVLHPQQMAKKALGALNSQ